MEKFIKMKLEVSLLTVLIFFAINIHSSEPLEFSGNLKVRGVGTGPVLKGASKRISQEHLYTTGRFKVSKIFNDRLSFDLAYDLSVVYNHITDPDGVLESEEQSFKYRMYDLHLSLGDDEVNSTNRYSALQNLDRFNLNYSNDFLDLIAGRQAVSFGSGRFINPTDVLVPYPLTQIDKEEREGVDALRLKLPISEMGELDVAAVSDFYDGSI